MEPDDAALNEIADPRFSEIVSSLSLARDRRNRHVIGHGWSFGDGQHEHSISGALPYLTNLRKRFFGTY